MAVFGDFCNKAILCFHKAFITRTAFFSHGKTIALCTCSQLFNKSALIERIAFYEQEIFFNVVLG